MINKQNLSQFTGTQQYYRHWLKLLVFTDGIKYLAENTNSFWLLDVIASFQHKLNSKYPFQLWELKVNEDKTATVTMKEDSNTETIVKQELEYTDFPFDYQKIYCIDNVVLLPSEY